jgi:hypothetical protein
MDENKPAKSKKEFKPAIAKPADFEPELIWKTGKRKGKARCIGWSKQAGRQCGLSSLPGKSVCRYHGGLSPSGKNSPSYKHGRNVRYKSALERQKALSEHYQASIEDEAILTLVPEIALTDARILELLEERTAFTSDMKKAIKLAHESHRDMCLSYDEGDLIAGEQAKKQLGESLEQAMELMESGRGADKREDELILRRQKLVETQTRRDTASNETILLTHALGALAHFAGEVLNIVREQARPDDARKIIESVKIVTSKYIE